MKVILKKTTFHLHDSFWRQEVGAAVGGRPISAYDIIFMAEIDEEILIVG